MNKIKNYFRRNTFNLFGIDKNGRYGIVSKGYCIAGVIISFNPLNLIKNGKIYNLTIVFSYYFDCFRTIIRNKINNYKVSKKNILFE